MLLMASILLAASAPTSAATAPSPSASAVESCALPEGWSEVASRQPRYVVFGELHGTQQGPAFIGNLACALASQKQRILVGVELDPTANVALQDAWKLPPGQFGQALVRAGWQARQDGVASLAMFALLVRLHKLKEAGLSIAVIAFDSDDAQERRFSDLAGYGPREAVQAENIHEAATRGSYDRVLVLTGNAHARKSRYGEGPESSDFMAARLASHAPVVSLDTRYATGTAWYCQVKKGLRLDPGQKITNDAVECGDHPAKGETDLKRTPFIGLGAFPGEEPDSRYDGFLWLGPISGSPPLLPGG
jgi:hypothetical protein